MYKHKNNGHGIITMVDSKGKHHVIRPGEIVIMDKINERKGIVCINKDAVKEVVVVPEQKEEIKEPKIKRRRID